MICAARRDRGAQRIEATGEAAAGATPWAAAASGQPRLRHLARRRLVRAARLLSRETSRNAGPREHEEPDRGSRASKALIEATAFFTTPVIDLHVASLQPCKLPLTGAMKGRSPRMRSKDPAPARPDSTGVPFGTGQPGMRSASPPASSSAAAASTAPPVPKPSQRQNLYKSPRTLAGIWRLVTQRTRLPTCLIRGIPRLSAGT